MSQIKDFISVRLRELADTDYKAFNERIVPTEYEALGVRMPALKALAREIAAGTASPNANTPGTAAAAGERGLRFDAAASAIAWLDAGDFSTYEHVILHGLTLAALARKMPLPEVLARLDNLIEQFDNWAHVDTVIAAFKVFERNKPAVLAHFTPLKTHAGEFHKRVFAVLLMGYYMDDVPFVMVQLAEITQGQYYVDMAVAWAVSVALIKNWDAALPFLLEGRFTPWVHNKAIQKARESFRISDINKAHLKELFIKK